MERSLVVVMMCSVLQKEELFFICWLAGAESLLGIEDMVEGLSLEEVKTKWLEVSEQLVSKNILSYDENNELYIDQKYAQLASILSFPEQVFACLVEKEEEVTAEFIHSRAGIYTHIKGEQFYEIQLIQDKEDGLTLLKEEFLLTDCESEVQVTLPAASVNYALALAGAGEVQSATVLLEPYGMEPNVIKELVSAFYDNPDTRVIAGYNFDVESPSEVLFTCARTEKGTWVLCVKPERDEVTLFRRQVNPALANILEFHVLERSS